MKNKVLWGLFFLGLSAPILLVYKSLFLPGPAVWGDAPYYTSSSLKALVGELPAWTNRGQNFGGSLGYLWLYPLMLVYGLLGTLFNFLNDSIIRILFYFPTLIFSFSAAWWFAKRNRLSGFGQFFTSLIYSLNTYLILLIDGGQVGVALAYSLFPLALIGIDNFWFGLFSIVAISLADFRLAAIALVCQILFAWRRKTWIAIWSVVVVFLHSFWWLPLVKIGIPNLGNSVSGLQLTSLLNSLLLFQPHWPLNQFGKVFPPPFYFIITPILIFGSKKWRMLLLFLIFAFLAKGESAPFGFIYSYIINHIPLGFAFRDSTKFYAPLLLFGGILIGDTISNLFKKNHGIIFVLLAYGYWMVTIFPALTGQLHGVLAERKFPDEILQTNRQIGGEPGFFRTLWFSEKHPLALETQDKPALDANRLVDLRIFSKLNVGSYDKFNLLHQPQAYDWLRLLGIKYLVFSGSPRQVVFDNEEIKNWHDLQGLVATSSALQRLDTSDNSPMYSLSSPFPRIFSTGLLAVVVGSDNISSPSSQPAIFLEDGKTDPLRLLDLPPDSLRIVFNDKNEVDLQMAWLQSHFLFADNPAHSQWAIGKIEDYLEWKFQLLIRGIDLIDLTYNRGIAYSSQAGEKLGFVLKAPQTGQYFLVVRSLGSTSSESTDVSFANQRYSIAPTTTFSWNTLGPLSLQKGKYALELANTGGVKAINVVGLIPQLDWDTALAKTRTLIDTFPLSPSLEPLNWQPVDYRQVNSSNYLVQVPPKTNWLIFSDSYHPKWVTLKSEVAQPAFPLYSSINGFYVGKWPGAEISLHFKGQENVRWGIYLSVLSALIFIISALLWYDHKLHRL